MAFTTRAGKGISLSHNEMDANFTTLGVAHGDTDISGMIDTVFDPNKTWTGDKTFKNSGNLIFGSGGYTYFNSKVTSGDVYMGQSTFVGDAQDNYFHFHNGGSTNTAYLNVINQYSKLVLEPGEIFINGQAKFWNGVVELNNLPTTQPASANQLWNDNGTVKIS